MHEPAPGGPPPPDAATAQADIETMLCGLAEQFNPHLAGHAQRVARLAEALAARLGTRAPAALRQAALFHDIGLLGIERNKLFTPWAALCESDRGLILLHAETGAALLRRLPWLEDAAELVAAHHERWDGTGYPNKLRAAQIPRGARILAVCDCYDEMLNKAHGAPRRFSEVEVVAHLRKERARRFDPQVVDAFADLLGTLPGGHLAAPPPPELALNLDELRAGQRLARDIRNAGGFVMLAQGTVLQDGHVQRLLALRDSRGVVEPIYVSR